MWLITHLYTFVAVVCAQLGDQAVELIYTEVREHRLT